MTVEIDERPQPDARVAAPARGGAASALPWLAAAGVLSFAVIAGRRLQADTPHVFLGAAPLVGRDPLDGWDWRFGWGLVGAAAVAAGVIAAVRSDAWWRLPTRAVIAATGAAAAAFATLLAATDGRDGLLYGAAHETEYLANLDIAPGSAEFVRDFLDDIQRYSVHVRGHPPGFVVVLQALDAIGLGGAWPAAGVSLVATALLPVFVLLAVRRAAGDQWVRRAAPMLVVSPYALWMVTSADALFAATGAAAVAAVGAASGSRARAAACGAIGGLALGALLFLTYGGATFAIVPLAAAVVSIVRRQSNAWLALAAGIAGVAVVVIGFALAGFWWLDGARETQRQYWAGTAQFRPGGYFAVANLAAGLIAIGPLGFAGLQRTWQRRHVAPPWWPLAVAGLVALVASHLSQYTRAEVERIWLLFYPWLAICGGWFVAADDRRSTTVAIGIQAACAITLQAALVSKW